MTKEADSLSLKNWNEQDQTGANSELHHWSKW